MVSDVYNVEYESELIKEDSGCLNGYDKEYLSDRFDNISTVGTGSLRGFECLNNNLCICTFYTCLIYKTTVY